MLSVNLPNLFQGYQFLLQHICRRGRKKVDFTNATRLVNLADNSAFYLNGTCLIGRDRTCNICLPMQSVSGEHAEVYPAKDGWYVADLNSKNGTLLNGEEVFGAFPLYDGDIISIGDYSFLFRE